MLGHLMWGWELWLSFRVVVCWVCCFCVVEDRALRIECGLSFLRIWSNFMPSYFTSFFLSIWAPSWLFLSLGRFRSLNSMTSFLLGWILIAWISSMWLLNLCSFVGCHLCSLDTFRDKLWQSRRHILLADSGSGMSAVKILLTLGLFVTWFCLFFSLGIICRSSCSLYLWSESECRSCPACILTRYATPCRRLPKCQRRSSESKTLGGVWVR